MSLKVAVLIPAAGSSSRFKGKTRKQFADIDGRAVFIRTIEAFTDRDDVKQIVIAIPADEQEMFEIKWGAKLSFYGAKIIIGGDSRPETVAKLLAEVSDDVDLIALHDAVRPCVTKKQIDDVFNKAAQTGAAILAGPLVGTIKQVAQQDARQIITNTVDRSCLWEAQTPQVFKPDIIRRAYRQSSEIINAATDDAQLVESLGQQVSIVPGDAGNIKITTGIDLAIAGAILKFQSEANKPKKPAGPWAAEQGW